MRRSKRQLDETIDRFLAGESVPDLDDQVTNLLGTLSDSTVTGYDTGLPASLAVEVTRASGVPTRTRFRAGRPLPMRWRRRIMLSTILSSFLGKLLIGSVALATTAGGFAATGNLPDPAQAWAAQAFDFIGVEIPGPDDAADDVAKAVTDVIENSDPTTGEDFGSDVADTASDGKASEGLDTADDNAEIVPEEVVPDQADPDTVLPDEADSADTTIPDQADDYKP
ncbi:MAG: hypothetical protein ACE5F5_00085 [Acidimicrobiia bacterium]